MASKESFLFDKRLLDPRWANAFRLKLTGWLPRKLAEEAVSQGTAEFETSGARPALQLTEEGRKLTDLTDLPDPIPNAHSMAAFLSVRGMKATDLEIPSGETVVYLSGRHFIDAEMLKEIRRVLEETDAREPDEDDVTD
ncbi:hypothetical protein [Mameliella sp.]|uniref:hypothetical protein n=1 Tax=Mameliella sp. TaxID=1924940 RepID=UPI003BACE856